VATVTSLDMQSKYATLRRNDQTFLGLGNYSSTTGVQYVRLQADNNTYLHMGDDGTHPSESILLSTNVGSGTKQLDMGYTDEENIDLLSSTRTFLRLSSDHYVTRLVAYNSATDRGAGTDVTYLSLNYNAASPSTATLAAGPGAMVTLNQDPASAAYGTVKLTGGGAVLIAYNDVGGPALGIKAGGVGLWMTSGGDVSCTGTFNDGESMPAWLTSA
jgi:hypothetical protein